MERYMAILTNGIVENVFVVDPDDAVTIAHFGGVLVPVDVPVAIGWSHDGQAFIAPPPPPIPTPTQMSMAQTRLALLATGHLDAVLAAVNTMPRDAQIRWEYATTVTRGDALITAIASVLSLDDAALDVLFVAGAKL